MSPRLARLLFLVLGLGLFVCVFLCAMFRVERYYSDAGELDLLYGLQLGAAFALCTLVPVRLRLQTAEFWQISAGALVVAILLSLADLVAAFVAAPGPWLAQVEVPPGIKGHLLVLFAGQGLVLLLMLVEGGVLLVRRVRGQAG